MEKATIIQINEVNYNYNKIKLCDIQIENTKTFQIYPFAVDNSLTAQNDVFKMDLSPYNINFTLCSHNCDFEPRIRDSVIDYIINKFGRENTANIGTFGMLKTKSAILDVARVFGIPSNETMNVTKHLDIDSEGDSLKEIEELNPELKVKVEGSHKVNVVTTEKEGMLLIQLVNTSGDHANPNVKGIDEIPALHNLELSVISSEKPKYVLLQPENIPLEFDFDSGQVTFTIPEIKIHNIVEIR
jgi:hypothetical protein